MMRLPLLVTCALLALSVACNKDPTDYSENPSTTLPGDACVRDEDCQSDYNMVCVLRDDFREEYRNTCQWPCATVSDCPYACSFCTPVEGVEPQYCINSRCTY